MFRLIFGLAIGMCALVFGLMTGALGILFGLGGALLGIGLGLLIPLSPFILIGVGIWLLVRHGERQHAVQ